MNGLFNVLLGIIASLIAWLLLTKALRPRIILGDTIDYVIRADSSEYYRLTYKRPRIRRVEDVHVSVRIFREAATRSDGRRTWNSCNIPVDEPFRPVLGYLPFTTRILRCLRGKRLLQRVRLELESLESCQFLANLPEGCPSIVCLHEFLQETDSTIEFAVRAADGYSGVYRTVAKTYKAQHVCVVDRRERQLANSSRKKDGEDASTPYLPAARSAGQYLPAERMAVISQKDKALSAYRSDPRTVEIAVMAVEADGGEVRQ